MTKGLTYLGALFGIAAVAVVATAKLAQPHPGTGPATTQKMFVCGKVQTKNGTLLTDICRFGSVLHLEGRPRLLLQIPRQSSAQENRDRQTWPNSDPIGHRKDGGEDRKAPRQMLRMTGSEQALYVFVEPWSGTT